MPSHKILVVEDDKLTLRMVKAKLEECGFSVSGVSNASDGLSKIQNELPDLVIVDLNLSKDPVFTGLSDGYGLVRWLSSTQQSAAVPVIVYTMDNSPGLEKRLGGARIFAVVTKDEPFEKLLETIHAALAQGAADGTN